MDSRRSEPDVRHVCASQLGERFGFGWRLLGGSVGFAFPDAAKTDWDCSDAFQFLAGAVGARHLSEGQRRALLAADLLSQSILSHRPATKIISVVQALEALLLPRSRASTDLPLARNIAFFGCGLAEETLCGRDRSTCMYLANDPARQADRANLADGRLGLMPIPGGGAPSGRQTLDLYDTRSALVHGEDRPVDLSRAALAEFRVVRWLLIPILEWLREHPDDPGERLGGCHGCPAGTPGLGGEVHGGGSFGICHPDRRCGPPWLCALYGITLAMSDIGWHVHRAGSESSGIVAWVFTGSAATLWAPVRPV